MKTIFGNRVWISFTNDTGFVEISFGYDKYNQIYREGFEQETWAVQLIAGTGDINNPTNTNIATYNFNIKFQLECNYFGVQYGQYHDLSTDYIVTQESKLVQINENSLKHADTMTACDYLNNRTLELWYTVVNPLNATDFKEYQMPNNIMSLDQDLRQVIIHELTSDTIVNSKGFDGSTNCTLSLPVTYNCTFNIKVKELSLSNDTYGWVGGGTVTINSECYRLAEAKDNVTIQNALWTWDQTHIDTVAHGYRLRDPGINFYLPKVLPTLFSTEFFYDRCGPIYYNITEEEVPEYYDYSYPSFKDGREGI